MKLPFSFSLKFVFRLLLPGLFVTVALYPVFRTFTDSLSVNLKPEHILALGTIVIGWFFIIFDNHIYMALEGRRYWPKWIRRLFLFLENKRLTKLLESYKEAKSEDRRKYIELSVELRRFPLNDDGNPVVIYPTRLGNLLTAYEAYPLRAYGMDSVFYWHRIWVAIDEDLREHVDSQQAIADSSAYMTAALFIIGLILIFYAGLQQLPFTLVHYLPETIILLIVGFSSLILSYITYRASQHLHANFGELFKSVFDIHRDKVSVDKTITQIGALTQDTDIQGLSTSDKYKIAWRYLHNYKIKTKEGIVSAASYHKSDTDE